MIALDQLPAGVRQAVEALQAANARLENTVLVKDQDLRRKDQIIQLQDEKIRLLNFQLWGPKGEKLSAAQTAWLFAEASVTAGEVQREAERPEAEKTPPPPRAKKPRAHHPGREPLPAHLERREIIIPCHPADCRCRQCGAERPVIGYETREELGCEPATFFVKVIKREKRGSHCLPEQGVVTAPVPPRIVPKGKLADEFILEVLVQKYQQHNPVYRQLAALAENHGVELDRKTVTDALLAAGELLRPVVRAQAAELLRGHYVQVDETTVPVQTGEKTGRAGPAAFLKGFRGTVQCDGYAAYDDLGPDITFAGCLAHARRGFVEAAKLSPLNPVPPEILATIGHLYAVETTARQQGLEATQRLALRQKESVPVMAALKDRLVAIRQAIPPGGKLAQACDYALGQWSRLEVYLQDGVVEIDNNWCEGAMRPLALGRKNWLHLGSEQAGPKVAAIASLVETCRRLDINLRAYLSDILPKLGDWPINRVAELTPTAWKAAHQKVV